MKAAIDTRFLTVHPRTLLWWSEREQCRRCAHCITTQRELHSGDPYTLMQCAALKRGRGDDTCISARDEGKPCGPEAKLFKAAA